jgi:Tol biopolymer transport system component
VLASIAFQNGDDQKPPGQELRVSSIDGQSSRTLIDTGAKDLALSPVWSPDGEWVAYLKARGNTTQAFSRTAAIEMRPAGGGPARTLVPGSRLPESTSLFCMNGRGCLSWSPDGRLFFTASMPSEADLTHGSFSIWAVPVDLRKGEAGRPVRVVQWADFYPDCLTLTADGKRLAFLKGRLHSDVYVGELSADGNSVDRTRRFTRDDRGLLSDPNAWTRDGRILFSSPDRGALGESRVHRLGGGW